VRPAAFLLSLSLLLTGAPGQGDSQILWQRSLEDALSVAGAEGRPILVAVNMDGESASDRIIRERYRAPEFVAATRGCVCVVASLFRHSPRDHDDRGRRIACPRFGEVTCGEHIALEPLLYDRYLSDGERVAPRHALIRTDGTKAWDLSLSFDLRDIDARLRASLGPASRPPALEAGTELAPPSWQALAMRRDHRGREELESALDRVSAPDELLRALDAVRQHGDRESLDALRVVCARAATLPQPVRAGLVDAVRGLDLQGAAASLLRGRIGALGPDAAATRLLADLDPASPGTRSHLLVARVLRPFADDAREALRRVMPDRAFAAIEDAVATQGGPVDVDEILEAARATTGAAPRRAGDYPRVGPITDAMPESRALRDVVSQLASRVERTDAPEVWAQFAKASLDLGRRRLENGDAGSKESFEAAETWFGRALERVADRADWWIERARTAYFLGDWESEAAHGRRALDVSKKRSPSITDDPIVIEALRWIGDGNARLIASRLGERPAIDVATLIEGLRALGTVAASAFGDANDWSALASLFETLGIAREELAIIEEAALRLPASPEIRDQLNRALWRIGRLDLAPLEADGIASRTLASAETASFAGYACLLAAEDRRRAGDATGALSLYARGRARYERALAFEERRDARLLVALSWMGEGMAHLLVDRRAEAAKCLVEAVKADPRVSGGRDGLGYDVLDLVDRIFEWRESGPSPVDASVLLAALMEADRGNPFWAIAISDSALREALRADGRNPKKAERETVDASGNAIRMPMGLPTEEGDSYLSASVAAAKAAVSLVASEDSRRALAQALTITAERMLERGRAEDARQPLVEAARLLEVETAELTSDPNTIATLAQKMRTRLGPARPRFRPGR
jgi:tetratricopeptide (TPR) repeat protein